MRDGAEYFTAPAGAARRRYEALRAAGHSVTEIAAAVTREGLPLSAQTCWQILDAEGIPRLPRRDGGRRLAAGQVRPQNPHPPRRDAGR